MTKSCNIELPCLIKNCFMHHLSLRSEGYGYCSPESCCDTITKTIQHTSEQAARTPAVWCLLMIDNMCSAMANALQAGEDKLAGDSLAVSLLMAAAAGTAFLVALQAGPTAQHEACSALRIECSNYPCITATMLILCHSICRE